MIIFPAIDIKNGKCVRLIQGEKDKQTIYFDDPLYVAKMWETKGAQYLHIVDLDGAFDGIPKNIDLIEKIVKSVSIPVQIGGGIRTVEIAKKYIEVGIDRIIVGTKAVTNPDFIDNLINLFGDRVAVSIDAKDGLVCINGWVDNSEIEFFDMASNLQNKGVSTIIYTDISKDGMMSGPNFSQLKELNDKLTINIIASGGISSLDDINKLKDMDFYGTIVGKALYEGALNLKDLI